MSDDHSIILKEENGSEVVDPELPKGSDPGRILFCLWPIPPKLGSGHWDRYEIDVLDYDSDTAVFWMHEGAGIDYRLDLALDIELEGIYVIESATCEWSTDYWGEVDEQWEIGIVRRATDEEIATEYLS